MIDGSHRQAVKELATTERRYEPAHDLAARATSKHGSPADHAIICFANVPHTAKLAASRIYAEAFELAKRSLRGEVLVSVDYGAGVRGAVIVVDVAPDGDSILDRGGFSLSFAPLRAYDGCPRFEGQVRVDQVDLGTSRVVAQGRYVRALTETSPDDGQTRLAAEEALRQVVLMLTAVLPKTSVASSA